MATLMVRNSATPDETRPFMGKGHLDVCRLGDLVVGKGVFEPGWRWSINVKPIAGTESCQADHVCYVLKGRMRIRMDDGQESDIGPGDFVTIPPGHDAWVLGGETCEILDFGGYENYARPRAGMPWTQAAAAATGDEASLPM